MIIPIPNDDLQRIEELKYFEILDSDPEEDFDDICVLASEICNTPISYVSLIDIDRQWFKSTKGIDIVECPRNVSICSYAINYPKTITEIPDARIDNRFSNNPSVTGDLKMVFYASIPLVTENGFAIGTICVLDKKPNKLTVKQKNALKILSKQVIKLLELRVKNKLLDKRYKTLKNKNIAFEDFTKSALNTITSPINTINILIEMIDKNSSKELSAKTKEYLNIINEASNDMIKMIKEIKEYYTNLDLIIYEKESFIINDLFNEIKSEISPQISVNFKHEIGKIYSNKLAIKTVLKKILNYSLKNNYKDQINISFSAKKEQFKFNIETKSDFDTSFITETTNLCNALEFNINFKDNFKTSLIELTN